MKNPPMIPIAPVTTIHEPTIFKRIDFWSCKRRLIRAPEETTIKQMMMKGVASCCAKLMADSDESTLENNTAMQAPSEKTPRERTRNKLITSALPTCADFRK